MLKAMLVDDVIYAISNLKSILKEANVDVVAHATNYKDAISLASLYKPDLIFLDIDLNEEKSGLDVASEIYKILPNIMIIYATGHAEYAIEACNNEAFVAAYILKPFSRGKIERVLNKVLTKINEGKVTFKSIGAIINISINDIYMIERESANSKKSLIHCKEKDFCINETLTSIEEKLKIHNNFYRTHKSFIVNIKKVRDIIKDNLNENSYIIKFDNMAIEALITRQKYQEIYGK